MTTTELSLMSPTQRRTLGPCSVSILVEEPCGIARSSEPVTVGVPLPLAAVSLLESLGLYDEDGQPVPLQVEALDRWPDHSLRWVLLDFQASVGSHATALYRLQWGSQANRGLQPSIMSIHDGPDAMIVDTGAATFSVDSRTFRPFAAVLANGVEVIDGRCSQIILLDVSGHAYTPIIRNIHVETRGPLRATIRAEGEFRPKDGTAFAYFIGRVSLYAGRGLAKVQFTIRNPRAARHPGGLWDLGDEGSVYFEDLSIHTRLRSDGPVRVGWTVQDVESPILGAGQSIEIYQDSSGGRNWNSSNHVNRFGIVPHTFRGYRITADELTAEGMRANPVVLLSDGAKALAGAVQNFWQNFPKAIEARENTLTIRLFPRQYTDAFELQGGEQKTHTVFLEFATNRNGEPRLDWTQGPLIPRVAPEWWCTSRVVPYVMPSSQDPHTDCLAMVDTAIKGDNTFFDRREVIDEYGWRHFGDLYADHEAVGHSGASPLVAHYNNQYDVIFGAVVQYARSGDRRWFQLADELARHVIDIDIYHTTQDRAAFNGGLFWHTDHYTDVGTATHRAYSRISSKGRASWLCGGGPSNEHNYTSGLLHYYYLTGEPAAREAVIGLADWVLTMDDGRQTAWSFLDRRPTGRASSTVGRDYHGPGRGVANSINALVDAYALTQERRYLAGAEDLIRRCIHPQDDIASRRLEDVEHRWSYTVLLQTLGKYLDAKGEWGERDLMQAYARASLLHYAEWMLHHEVPYKQVLDRVQIPTETWPAQDIRKSHVFHLAAKYAGEPLQSAFRQRANYFFNACIADLLSFPTYTLTRPIVLLLTNGFLHAYFTQHPNETAPLANDLYNFGEPCTFTPQLYGLYKARERLRTLMVTCRQFVRRALGRAGA